MLHKDFSLIHLQNWCRFRRLSPACLSRAFEHFAHRLLSKLETGKDAISSMISGSVQPKLWDVSSVKA